MIIKVLLNRITLDLSEDFAKARDYFKPYFNIDYIFEETDFKGLSARPIVGGGSVLKGLHHVYGAKPQIKAQGEDIIIFCFNQDEFKEKMTSNMDGWIVPGTTHLNVTTSKKDQKVGWIWKSICHEIMHALFQKVYFAGNLNVEDPMDKMLVKGKWKAYYKNSDPFAKDGNYAEAKKRLAPYWHLFQGKPVVTLYRQRDDGVQTLGKLSVGTFVCKTLERPWKFNLPNISCIPKGIYSVTYTYSPKFLKYTYQIQNVENRTGIRIHSGNFWFDIEGCILLGDRYSDVNFDGSLDILNSRTTVKAFEAILNKAPFTLVIT